MLRARGDCLPARSASSSPFLLPADGERSWGAVIVPAWSWGLFMTLLSAGREEGSAVNEIRIYPQDLAVGEELR